MVHISEVVDEVTVIELFCAILIASSLAKTCSHYESRQEISRLYQILVVVESLLGKECHRACFSVARSK